MPSLSVKRYFKKTEDDSMSDGRMWASAPTTTTDDVFVGVDAHIDPK